MLQLGEQDWSEIYTIPEGVDFYHIELFEKAPKKVFDLVFVDRILKEEEIMPLHKAAKADCFFLMEGIDMTPQMQWLYQCKKGQRLQVENIQKFLSEDLKFYFPKPYGEKFNMSGLTISRNFTGKVKWNGNCNVSLNGNYGTDFIQLMYWRGNIPVYKGQTIDLWLEYQKDKEVTISLRVTQFRQGSIDEIINQWEFSEEDLENVVRIDSLDMDSSVFISLYAKGQGNFKLVALHDRYSRKDKGYFIPGGERYVTSDREEIFCYFDPGDLKPPLNIYFSGYKTLEGFESYFLMRKMGCPFLLIAEARLEGGSFYMGSEEYEGLLVQCIEKYMNQLGFSRDQVILSGLSMGTFGALYYSCDIRPHAVILGKPLASIGDIAANEKRFRPGGFPTSLDILKHVVGENNREAITKLNNRFWDKFDTVKWDYSKFIIAYMMEDDYDATAYEMLISHIKSAGVQIYGKGIHGRHNDDTMGIISWFSSQYRKVLREDFSRRFGK